MKKNQTSAAALAARVTPAPAERGSMPTSSDTTVAIMVYVYDALVGATTKDNS